MHIYLFHNQSRIEIVITQKPLRPTEQTPPSQTYWPGEMKSQRSEPTLIPEAEIERNKIDSISRNSWRSESNTLPVEHLSHPRIACCCFCCYQPSSRDLIAVKMSDFGSQHSCRFEMESMDVHSVIFLGFKNPLICLTRILISSYFFDNQKITK